MATELKPGKWELQRRTCHVCGSHNGAITCFKSAFANLGMPQMSYAHKRCFEKAQKIKIKAQLAVSAWLKLMNQERRGL